MIGVSGKVIDGDLNCPDSATSEVGGSLYSEGCYLDECQSLALVQVDSGTYTGDTESLE